MCGRYYYVDKTAYEVEDDLHLFKGAFAASRGDITPGMTDETFRKSYLDCIRGTVKCNRLVDHGTALVYNCSWNPIWKAVF